jgi:hypothetical protein
MTEQGKKSDEKTLLDLLSKGDIAGLEKALGLHPGEFERIMLDQPDDDPDDDYEDDEDRFADLEDEEEDEDEVEDEDLEDDDVEDWLPRPEWLHPECRNVCSALDLGTCCKYPDNPLVRVAVDFAGSAGRAVGRVGEAGCAEVAAELTRCFRMIPGLLAQIHAVLPRLNRTARAQLLCPVGALASALDQACGDGCPWGCGEAMPDRRAELGPMIELVAECSTAIRTALNLAARGQAPIAVRPGRGAAPDRGRAGDRDREPGM